MDRQVDMPAGASRGCGYCGARSVRVIDNDGYVPNELVCDDCFTHEVVCWDDLPLPRWPTQPDVDIAIQTMQLSDDRVEHYVQIKCGDRQLHTNRYGAAYLNRARYEADMLRHVLLDEPKPNLMDDQYADPEPTGDGNGE